MATEQLEKMSALKAHGLEDTENVFECEWTCVSFDMWRMYETSCQKVWENDSLNQFADDLNYCPWCGRRIKIKG